MLTTKTDPLNGQLKNPFSINQQVYSDFTSFTQYKNTLDNNLQVLKKRFPL
jgi:hypothetical protein